MVLIKSILSKLSSTPLHNSILSLVLSRNSSFFSSSKNPLFLTHQNVNNFNSPNPWQPSRGFGLTGALLRARKGTRERKEKIKKKIKAAKLAQQGQEVKLSFIERKKKEQMAGEMYIKQRPFDDTLFPEPIDDVFYHNRFKGVKWPFGVALENHREIHHETAYNRPKAVIYLRINIDMTYPNRPNKFNDPWKAIVEMKKPFLLEGMKRPTILAFCPSSIQGLELVKECTDVGAELAGSTEMIRMIQEGNINANEYEIVVAHPLVVNELTAIRGLLKGKFPNTRTRTINVDVPSMVKRFKGGIKYITTRSLNEPDFAFVRTPIGTLDMDSEDLEGNFQAFVHDVLDRKLQGKDPHEYIVSCVLETDFSMEKMSVDINQVIKDNQERGPPKQEIDLDLGGRKRKKIKKGSAEAAEAVAASG